MSEFSSKTIASLGQQVAQLRPATVTLTWQGTAIAGYLSFQGDDLVLAGRSPANDQPFQIQLSRREFTQAVRRDPQSVDLILQAQSAGAALQRISCTDSGVLDRLMAWLPTEATQQDLIKTWYRSNLGAYRKQAYVTYSIIGLTTFVYLLQVLAAGAFSFTPEQLIAHQGQLGPLVLNGEVWRMLCAVFLHGSLDHLVGNMVVLAIVGPYAERLFGRMGFLAVYLCAGLMGSAMDNWLNFAVVTVGASGAVWGVFGSLITYAIWRRNDLPLRSIRVILICAGVHLLYQLYVGLNSEGTNNSAHVFGFLGGTLAALLLAPPLERTQRRRHAWIGATLTLFGGVVLGIISIITTRIYSTDWHTFLALDRIHQRIGEMEQSCGPALEAVRAAPGAERERFKSACVDAPALIVSELARYQPRDEYMRQLVTERKAQLHVLVDRNRKAYLAFGEAADMQAIENNREAVLEVCRDVIRGIQERPLAASSAQMTERCIPGLTSAQQAFEQLAIETDTLGDLRRRIGERWAIELELYRRIGQALEQEDPHAYNAAVDELSALYEDSGE